MKALVTGGAGFIGSHLTDALLRDGADVTVLDDLSSGRVEYVNPKANLIQGDVGDFEAVADAMTGVDVVFHQAAHRAVLRSVEHPVQTDRANVGGTVNVLEAARRSAVRRVVYASSSSVYGGAEQHPTPETAPTVPRSPYAVSKLTGELYCRVFFELFGLETVSLRYFNVYGPRQRPDSRYATVIPLFIEALASDRPAEIHGDGLQSRDFTFIHDVVRANIVASTSPADRCAGKAYNVAGGRPYSLLQLLELVGDRLSATPRARHIDPRPGDVRHTHADMRAARDDLGFEPEYTFEDGLARTVSWFRAGVPA